MRRRFCLRIMLADKNKSLLLLLVSVLEQGFHFKWTNREGSRNALTWLDNNNNLVWTSNHKNKQVQQFSSAKNTSWNSCRSASVGPSLLCSKVSHSPPPQVLLPHVFWNEGEGLHTGRLHITSADQDCCQNPRLRAFARRSLQHWSCSSHVLSNTDIYIHWLSPGISTSYQTDTSTVPDLMKLVQWWPGDNAIEGSCE